MAVEKIKINSEQHWLDLRKGVVGSTEISALFGCNKYMSAYELHHLKAGTLPDSFVDNERATIGRTLEPAIARVIADRHALDISPLKTYAIDRERRLGSSFDFQLADGGLLEIKNLDGLIYRNEWTEDEMPLHIELQVQHELLMSGAPYCLVGALIGGTSTVLIRREPDDNAMMAIVVAAKKFWAGVDAGTPPAPDFNRDAEAVNRLYSFATPGKLAEPTAELKLLADEYKQAASAQAEAVKRKDAAKAKILMLIGDAERVRGDTFSISAGLVGPAQVSYTREGYRSFRVNLKGNVDGPSNKEPEIT